MYFRMKFLHIREIKHMNEFLFAPFIKSINMMNLGTNQVVKYLHKYVSIY